MFCDVFDALFLCFSSCFCFMYVCIYVVCDKKYSSIGMMPIFFAFFFMLLLFCVMYICVVCDKRVCA